VEACDGEKNSQAPVALLVIPPTRLLSRQRSEDHSSRPALSKIPNTKKRLSGVAQVVEYLLASVRP
jgi:hypothetical protein